MNPLFNAVALTTAVMFSSTSVAAERAMIILDGSGSMWGQIDGKTKHQIALQALRDVLNSATPTTELGLMAYGHREKGNCKDIEVLVEPAANSKDAIIRAAEQMKFLGKTPLSAAVAQAAESLRYTEDKATVILITDGQETCQADPCALGAELKSKGVDFTAHVVGFNLTQQEGEQVACLASSTGGQYIKADDAAELEKAMASMVQHLELPAPEPAASVELPEPEPEVVPPALSEATVDGPEATPAGSVIEVAWTGPAGPGDYITVVVQGAPDNVHGPYTRIGKAASIKLQVPDALGPYEIRYIDQAAKRVLATQNIELIPVSAAVTAPETAGAGARIDVTWDGPNSPGDYIAVVDSGAPDKEYINYARTANGSPLKLLLPDELGNYEVRYVLSASKRVLASTPIVLTGVEATLAVQNKPVPGGNIVVAWTGPNNSGDYVTVVPKGAAQAAYTSYERTASGPTLTLKAPAEVGQYEIRYVVDQSKRVLLSIPLDLDNAAVSLAAPASVAAGSAFAVEWTGPGNRNDFIEIVAHDAPADAKPLVATRTSQGSPLQMFAPGIAGQYQIRYMMRDTKEVAAHTPLKVD